jgi:hypothetical protein
MSSAFVPGRIRRDAPLLRVLVLGKLTWSSKSDIPGDVGPIWSSAIGGGEGSRGDEAGDRAAIVIEILEINQRSHGMCSVFNPGVTSEIFQAGVQDLAARS